MLIQELNTAEDFISFYEEMIPLVQTLPQIVLHREELFSALLLRVNMSARLSLEPILMYVYHGVMYLVEWNYLKCYAIIACPYLFGLGHTYVMRVWGLCSTILKILSSYKIIRK